MIYCTEQTNGSQSADGGNSFWKGDVNTPPTHWQHITKQAYYEAGSCLKLALARVRAPLGTGGRITLIAFGAGAGLWYCTRADWSAAICKGVCEACLEFSQTLLVSPATLPLRWLKLSITVTASCTARFTSPWQYHHYHPVMRKPHCCCAGERVQHASGEQVDLRMHYHQGQGYETLSHRRQWSGGWYACCGDCDGKGCGVFCVGLNLPYVLFGWACGARWFRVSGSCLHYCFEVLVLGTARLCGTSLRRGADGSLEWTMELAPVDIYLRVQTNVWAVGLENYQQYRFLLCLVPLTRPEAPAGRTRASNSRACSNCWVGKRVLLFCSTTGVYLCTSSLQQMFGYRRIFGWWVLVCLWTIGGVRPEALRLVDWNGVFFIASCSLLSILRLFCSAPFRVDIIIFA